MSDNESADDRDVNRKDEHGRDVELAKEKSEEEREAEEEELAEEQEEARREREEAERKQDIEERTVERESDALENANPDHHRDEEPYNS
ncbi:hypothetical protein ACFQGT_00635 [Natrialbaceae archaeon GCM10025810]|uniref:hypothetical protein n=1 Tax=Halovalidus salilacus TaxID=3075124 RepID=UPI00360E22F9